MNGNCIADNLDSVTKKLLEETFVILTAFVKLSIQKIMNGAYSFIEYSFYNHNSQNGAFLDYCSIGLRTKYTTIFCMTSAGTEKEESKNNAHFICQCSVLP